MPKRKLLNVRAHIEHCEMIFAGLKQYGYCPALVEEVNKASLIGRCIIKRADQKREKGDRKDLYIGKGNK